MRYGALAYDVAPLLGSVRGVLPAGCGGDGVSAPVPWRKPRLVLSWPDQPETRCPKEAPHLAHAWEEVAPEHQVIQWTGSLEDIPMQLPLVQHYCKGGGHLRGYL
jgi:hypothetical protein